MTTQVQIGNATLILGDCREILPTLPRVDACVTDPPYGIAFKHSGNDTSGKGKGKWRTKFAGVSIHGDDRPFDPSAFLNYPTVILWGANHYANLLPNYPSWLIWDKRASSNHQNDFADCEIAWTNTGKVARVFRHQWDGMMKASEHGVSRHHPTQKPILLMRWCIEQIPANAHTILDPYMGSGTTGVACAQMGRAFIGIEIDPRYFEIACRRIEAAQAQPDMFIEPAPMTKAEQLGLELPA